MRKKILVIDDEADVIDLLKTSFRTEFSILAAGDGPTGLKMTRERIPDVIVLDLMLPGMNGFEFCRAIQTDPSTRHIPIVMLTARADEVDRLVGLELGADDYVTKPFSPRELMLRIKAIIRRTAFQSPRGDILKLGPLIVDRARHLVTLKTKELPLTAIEFKLLVVLIERPERLLSRDLLLRQVWGDDSSVDVRTVDTHVSRLREKLGSFSEHIQTVRGFGYRISEYG